MLYRDHLGILLPNSLLRASKVLGSGSGDIWAKAEYRAKARLCFIVDFENLSSPGGPGKDHALRDSSGLFVRCTAKLPESAQH